MLLWSIQALLDHFAKRRSKQEAQVEEAIRSEVSRPRQNSGSKSGIEKGRWE